MTSYSVQAFKEEFKLRIHKDFHSATQETIQKLDVHHTFIEKGLQQLES